MEWLKQILCRHDYAIEHFETTGEHDFFARVYGNSIAYMRCRKCGHYKRKVGYSRAQSTPPQGPQE